MAYRKSLILGFLFLSAACTKTPAPQSQTSAAPGASQPTPITSEGVVRFAVENVELPKGGSAEAIVHVTVQNGYHVNANPPTYSFLIPLELQLTPSGGITVAFIRYPDSVVKKFPFAEKPVAIYEGDTQLKVQLKAASSASQGTSNLAGKLKVQACDDKVCYPPGEIAVTVPVNVR